jgi:probable phosphoglycerate mutase
VLRGHNREADDLANQAMDKGSGKAAFQTPKTAPQQQEFKGVVRGGKVELSDGSLPDGTQVDVRVRRG